MIDFRGRSKRRAGFVAVVAAALSVAACSGSVQGHPTDTSAVRSTTGSAVRTSSSPSKFVGASPGDIAAVLSAAKRDQEIVGSVDFAHPQRWAAATSAVTAGVLYTECQARASVLGKSAARNDHQQMTVRRVGLTSLTAAAARVDMYLHLDRTGSVTLHQSVTAQASLTKRGGRWLLESQSDSTPPLAANLDWAPPDVRDAMRQAADRVVAMYALVYREFDDSVSTALSGLTGDARRTYSARIPATKTELGKDRALAYVANLSALGVEPSSGSTIRLLASLTVDAVGVNTHRPKPDVNLSLTMAKQHGQWLISSYSVLPT